MSSNTVSVLLVHVREKAQHRAIKVRKTKENYHNIYKVRKSLNSMRTTMFRVYENFDCKKNNITSDTRMHATMLHQIKEEITKEKTKQPLMIASKVECEPLYFPLYA